MGFKKHNEMNLELEEGPTRPKLKDNKRSQRPQRSKLSVVESDSLTEKVENLKKSLFWPTMIILALPIIPVFFGILIPEKYILNPAAYGFKAKMIHYFELLFIEIALIVGFFRRRRRMRRTMSWFE